MGNPVNFSGCAGFVHDGGGAVGVIMLPAWGFEELTIRRGWAIFADLLAEAGYCALRFDWPGFGDSLGDGRAVHSFMDWRNSVHAAADLLNQQYGSENIVLVGHGIGGLLAPHCADLVAAKAVVLMAPQSPGKAGLREMKIASKMVSSFLRLSDNPSNENIEIAGHSISVTLASEIAGLQLELRDQKHTPIPALAVLPAQSASGSEWTTRLAEAGFSVSTLNYAGLTSFVGFTHSSVAPLEDFGDVRRWLVDTVPVHPRTKALKNNPVVNILRDEDFSEQPILFGPQDNLFGIICRPLGSASRAVVVLINSGENNHTGWGRMHVEFCRALARERIASFRIDTGGIGDAADVEGPLFYVDRQINDVIEAVKIIDTFQLGPILLTGRCSGGYAALQAAIADTRVKGLVAVNTVRLGLAPGEDFDQIIGAGTSSLAEYRRRALSLELVKDVFTGRKSMLSLVGKGVRVMKQQLSLLAPQLFGISSNSTDLTNTIVQKAQDLLHRRVVVFLVYAENDGGLDELARHFGKLQPADYKHATVRIALGAEHNMTASHARKAILKSIIDAVGLVENRVRPNSYSALEK
ncbi:alpha/beta fold hydrolase [Rhizobium tumorigenes]|uniref:Alpha/beta fold hydrolase n=1 Tax=Rhizobium tumorigenes TaxID=2041385 RepID=A0AAF1KW19_9HYPH|nr:alpha/beta fold hydrolase [Rhizobium tumorigenes]WFR97601.1 alpha/beta fold hydrolase [Rhizobium tumorigenes]WFS03204.1 alpha/beta fold hydrolase [Rhizobium tumorigenes]